MLQVCETKNAVLFATADHFTMVGTEAIATNGRFSVALSGGGSPKGLYELLSSQYALKLEWNKVYFFFGDERYVPADHPDSNALMAKKALFDPLKIDPSQIFLVDTSLSPDAAAAAYQQDILQHFAPGVPAFDLILLGLGDDAHTASLFPGTEMVMEPKAGVKDVFLPDKQVFRITFTAPLINLAKQVAFLVFGQSKASAVQQVLEGEKDNHKYPAAIVKPVSGELVWFMDTAAASRLKNREKG